MQKLTYIYVSEELKLNPTILLTQVPIIFDLIKPVQSL